MKTGLPVAQNGTYECFWGVGLKQAASGFQLVVSALHSRKPESGSRKSALRYRLTKK